MHQWMHGRKGLRCDCYGTLQKGRNTWTRAVGCSLKRKVNPVAQHAPYDVNNGVRWTPKDQQVSGPVSGSCMVA